MKRVPLRNPFIIVSTIYIYRGIMFQLPQNGIFLESRN